MQHFVIFRLARLVLRFGAGYRLLLLPLLAGLLLLGPGMAHAQMGIGTATPNPAAAVEISSADKGLLIPRLTPAARRAIGAPPQGMLVFQTGNAAAPPDSVGIWYATGQGRRWLYLPDAQQTQPKAANGLTKSGNTVQLGGALTQPFTTISGDVGQVVRVTTDGVGAAAVDQQQLQTAASTLGSPLTTSRWQSFTAGTNQALVRANVQLDVYTPGNLVCYLHQGEGQVGPPLRIERLPPTTAGYGQILTIPFATPLPLVAGQQYTLVLAELNGFHTWRYAPGDPYPGGRADAVPTHDRYFATYTAPVEGRGLALAGGQVYLTGLTGPALLNVAADGAVGTQPVASVADNLGSHRATQALALHDNALHLRSAPDAAHSLRWDAAPDGPRLSGLGGGELGTRTGAGAFTSALRWTANQRVGIGLSGAPTQALDVNGNIAASGSLAVAGEVQMGWEQVEQTYSMAGNTRIAMYLGCPSGTRLLGGGGGHRDANGAAGDITVRYSGPDPNSPTTTWRLIVSNSSSNTRAVRVYCMCARMGN